MWGEIMPAVNGNKISAIVPPKGKDNGHRGSLKTRVAKAVARRVIERLPNGKSLYEILEKGDIEKGIDYLKENQHLLRPAVDKAKFTLQRVAEGTSGNQSSGTNGNNLEDRLLLDNLLIVDEEPKVGDLVVITNGNNYCYSKNGSFGYLKWIEGYDSGIEFHYLSGDRYNDKSIPVIFGDIKHGTYKKAIFVEEGRAPPRERTEVMFGSAMKRSKEENIRGLFSLFGSDKTRADLGTAVASASGIPVAYSIDGERTTPKMPERRGITASTINYFADGFKELPRIIRDHFVWGVFVLGVTSFGTQCISGYIWGGTKKDSSAEHKAREVSHMNIHYPLYHACPSTSTIVSDVVNVVDNKENK